ncbi:hypothetical protein [Actinacidiphila acidipaludis]|uniref:Uncharacterized protein n=1 Tax=Actinacidiphila acidipaludis TaxID=2873382 RepID=A0ABS7QIX7_9ACTN|nr:hypothetical protein [Streptomyces acidipaludis]MBY8883138.1 hypothetical protein [Streptomyces acidipaludis]
MNTPASPAPLTATAWPSRTPASPAPLSPVPLSPVPLSPVPLAFRTSLLTLRDSWSRLPVVGGGVG